MFTSTIALTAALTIGITHAAVLVTREESWGGYPAMGGYPSPASSISQCNTGPVQCCNQVQSAHQSPLAAAFGLLGLALGPLDAMIAADCTSVSVIGTSGNSCSAQPVCCTGNHFGGLVNIGCSPINLNL